MHYSGDTKTQADSLYHSMRVKGVPSFQSFNDTSRFLVLRMIKIAKTYHTIQTHKCNGTSYSGMDTKEVNQAHNISEIAKRFGLTVEFTGDPRGFCVKLHSPNGDVYNTWGGPTSGYGIG